MKVTIMRAMRGEFPSMDVYADGLARGMREARPGWEIREVEPKLLPNQGIASKVQRALNGLARYADRFWTYPQEALAGSPDIVHVVSDHYFQVARFPRSAGTKVVATCHDLIYYQFRSNIEQFAAFVGVSRAAQEFGMRSLRSCDHVITLSQDNVRDLGRILGVPESKTTIIHNAVPGHFRPVTPEARRAARAELGIPEDQFAMVHVGTVEPRKNVDAILGALAGMKGERVLFVKVGNEFTPVQQERIEREGTADAIRHLGRIPNEQMVRVYHACDVLIFPSLYEGFPFPVVEAMACGVPVITSTASSLPETAGGAALLVDPHDIGQIQAAVRRLRDSGEARAEAVAKGYERVRKLTWKDNADAVAGVYERLFAGRSGAAEGRGVGR